MNIPKSLHTVTAIVAVARYINPTPAACECAQLARHAAVILGHDPADDTYGLIGRAADTLKKGAA